MTYISGPQRWFTVAEAVHQAVYAGLSTKPDRHGVVPGEIAWDGCDCGLLAVTVRTVFLSDAFPRQATENVSTQCRSAYEVAEIVVQIVRCVPGPGDNGDPPSPATLSTAAQTWAQDAGELLSAVNTLVCQMVEAEQIVDGIIRQLTSQGPEGLCGGSELSVLIGLPRG